MATTSFYTLFESASGYGLFSILETEEIGAFLEEVRFSAIAYGSSTMTLNVAFNHLFCFA